MILAQLNLDHFGADGRTAYNAGHYTAIEAAANGNLELAYSMNAFADHFLGDAFASGHFRTPRRKLHGSSNDIKKAVDTISRIVLDHSTADMIVALRKEVFNPSSDVTGAWNTAARDFYSKFMHDEDNKVGLWLVNKRGDTWQAFGDSKMFDPNNQLNCKFMLQALQASATEVYEAYKNRPAAAAKDTSTYKAWDITPSAELPGRNHQPLFDQNGWYRSSIDDPNCRKYTNPRTAWIVGYKLLSIQLFQSKYFENLK